MYDEICALFIDIINAYIFMGATFDTSQVTDVASFELDCGLVAELWVGTSTRETTQACYL